MGLLLLIAAGGIIALLFAASVFAAYRRQFSLARRLSWGGGAVAAVYVAGLAATNLSASPRVLPPGQDLRFCGFYLDCHLAAAVEDTRVVDSLGLPPFQATPGGAFWVVTVRISSNARRAVLQLGDPQVFVVDARGQRYPPSALGAAALRALGVSAPGLDQPVAAGGAYTTSLIFDLPRNAGPFVLHIKDGWVLDRVIESLLFGDDDGWLRPHPAFALSTRQ